MKKTWLSLFVGALFFNNLYAQEVDSTSLYFHYFNVITDSTKYFYLLPGPQRMIKSLLNSNMLSDTTSLLSFRVTHNPRTDVINFFRLKPEDKNQVIYDLNQWTNNYQYVNKDDLIKLESDPDGEKHFTFGGDPAKLLNILIKDNKDQELEKLTIPSREELDVLQILWVERIAEDTKIYSKLDSSINLTMTDLNNLLESMDKKNIINRELISPEQLFQFAVYGNVVYEIEEKSQNRKNRLYINESNVSEDLMKKFIRSCAWLIENDSTVLQQEAFKIFLVDSTLLDDLMAKINK